MKNSPYLDKPLRSLAEVEAQREARQTQDVEITAEMVEAGLRVCRASGLFDELIDSTLEGIIVEVYEEMAQHRVV